MDINNCPECGAETMSGGMALWADLADAVIVVECIDEGCGWAGVAEEYWAEARPVAVASAA